MDAANKQDAIVAEVTQGTTPATPAFKLLRSSGISGSPTRIRVPSPERRPDRAIANMIAGLHSYQRQIVTPFVRDAATDILWASLLNSTYSGNVIKNGSTASFLTLEEKYEAGATDIYHRHAGCQVNSLGVNFRLGDGGVMTWDLMAMGNTQATTAISSSTYAVPTPAVDPVSSVDVTVSSLFGISSPKVTAFQLQISNNMSFLHKFGSAEPFGLGLGRFTVEGSVELYFSAAAEYTAFVPFGSSLTMSLVIGSSSGNKDQFDMAEVDVFDPVVSDPGATGQHMLTLRFMGRYDSGDASVFKHTRSVA